MFKSNKNIEEKTKYIDTLGGKARAKQSFLNYGKDYHWNSKLNCSVKQQIQCSWVDVSEHKDMRNLQSMKQRVRKMENIKERWGIKNENKWSNPFLIKVLDGTHTITYHTATSMNKL